jgi:hypothetical protein
MRLPHLLLSAGLLLPLNAPAEGPKGPTEVSACMQRNTPEPDSIRAIRMVARDRVGAERVTVVKLYGRTTEEGNREVRIRVQKPDEIRGDSLLILERPTETEMYFKSSDSPKAKRIRTAGQSMPLFGSDFTYEDFAHLLAMNRPGKSRRLADEEVGDRSVYVLETRAGKVDSSYDSITTFVDKERCMALRIEFYDTDDQLRKVLSVNPAQVLKRGDIWLAHMSTMRDLRDRTTTQVFVDSEEQDVLFAKDTFSIDASESTHP